ncbi:MAG TPA: TonB-dependent receptor [Candidatus Binatus sp.]|nr:TonB-dependent receptor [Candidatus Binatus sp.]
MSFLRITVALTAAVCVFSLGARALAGTTGGIQGRAIDQSNSAPVADATITAAAPSQTATTKSEASGHFAFISLAPDTYTLTATKTGFTTISVPGVTVIADQTRNVTLVMPEAVKTLGTVTTTANQSLVRPGTTSNVFSVNAVTQKAVQAVAGAGSLNQSYGAIATSPGVVYQQGQQGWYQSVIIRGGDIDQTAYEMDGVPTMRVSDSGTLQTLSNLGQAELQVYTGGTPASAEASGIAGYVNQVVRQGTYPAFGELTLGIGSPALYNKFMAEYGGATADRQWTYYIGFANSAQAFRYGDQNNGAGNPLFFFPLVIPSNNGTVYDGSGTAIFAPGQTYAQATNTDVESVINIHYGIQHAHDTGRDDVQALYVYSNLTQNFYSSQNDLGLNVPSALIAAYGSSPMLYLDIPFYNGSIYQAPDPNQLTTQLFPNTGTDRMALAPIPLSEREGSQNGMGLFKLQYQKNFNSQTYLRVLGADNYGWWFITGPVSANLTFGDQLPDYEVITHNWVGSVQFSRQMNDKNLLNATASYFTGKLQTYSMGFFDGFMTNLVDAGGNCYDSSGAFSTCFGSNADPTALPVNRGTACSPAGGPILPPCITNLAPAVPPPGTPGALNGAQWLITENGANAQIDNVRPDFIAASVSDQWRPNDKTTISVGLRFQDYTYTIPNMVNGYPARAFWFSAYNREFCFSPGQGPGLGLQQRTDAAGDIGVDPATGAPLACPATPGGATFGQPVNLQNFAGGKTTDVEWEPRIAFTQALSANTVIRGSYGRYSRPAPTSYTEFNTVQQNLPAFISSFLPFGYNSPFHQIHADVANNYDLSLEQQIPHTDMSFKVTPFWRSTQNQIQYLSLNAQGVVDGLNVGQQTSKGVEFTFNKGNFAANGFALLLTATYTNSTIRYNDFSNGRNVIDLMNEYIQQYNSFTSACAAATPSLNGPCGLQGSGLAHACFLPGSTTPDDACGVGSIANPYFGQALQPLFDRNGSYTTYDQIPAPFNNAIGFATPFETTLVLNYKHDKWTITPNLTYSTQGKYGSPLVWPGYDPTTCTGTTVGNAADTTTCGNFLFIPDKFTGHFDNLGAFAQPQRLTAGLQVGYEVNPHMSALLTFANLVDTCYQHHQPWDNGSTCMYAQLASNLLAPAGNFVANPPIQLAFPYGNWYNNLEIGQEGQKLPVQATLQVTFKL